MSKIVGLTFGSNKKAGGKKNKPPENKKPDDKALQQSEGTKDTEGEQ